MKIRLTKVLKIKYHIALIFNTSKNNRKIIKARQIR